jgi:large subunit ribosomal protein L9
MDNVKGIGQVGDIKAVSDGYARNWLLPRGLAKPATPGVLKEVATLKTKKLQSLTLVHQEAIELAKKLAGTTVQLTGKASEKGTLFSAITPAQIAEALSVTAGIAIPPDTVVVDEHLKTVGEHLVHLRFAEDVTTDVTVTVAAQ